MDHSHLPTREKRRKKKERRTYEKEPRFKYLVESLLQMRVQQSEYRQEVERREKEVLEREAKVRNWFRQQENEAKVGRGVCCNGGTDLFGL
jgi:hypothetical protein